MTKSCQQSADELLFNLFWIGFDYDLYGEVIIAYERRIAGQAFDRTNTPLDF